MFKFFKKTEKQMINPEDLLTKADYKKRLFKWMMLLASAVLATLMCLLINYFVLKDVANKPIVWNSQEVFALVIVIVFSIAAVVYSVLFFVVSSKVRYNDADQNKRNVIIAGVTAGFTDTISVGSFGIGTAILKGTKSIKDDTKLPGTLNVAFALSGTLEAALFVSAIEVDVATLLILLASILVGTFVGSALVAKIKDPKIVKVSMGVVLFVVAIMMILTHPHVNAIKQTDIGLATSLMDKAWRIIVGTIIFFFLGMVQSFGIGLFAPALASLSFLGLKQEAIFPIMSCSSALSMFPAAFNFIRKKQYMQLTASLMQIFSVFGLIAAFLIVFVGIKSALGAEGDALFQAILKWLAIAVIFYVSITMLVEYYLLVKNKNKEIKVKG
ncbi:hypothetical protein ELUMI_v1c01670 [Williamsoniiplasma luminosum]|uniref:Probable membrane transporter protein n=2 Tax=Williamsoniiplasma luminosum TaxID=214888 RepID=A0A2K8NSR7_9MOLU|nr:hypothetical protein ELUMI_v1c01670 [Williamsoniiplasma luminosum]